MNQLILKDLNNIMSDTSIPWELLHNKSILITGATGLIGSLLVKSILYYSSTNNKKITVGVLVRNKEKAQKLFSEFDTSNLVYEVCDVNNLEKLSIDYDYIIHTASTTTSIDFIKKPVETILTTVQGTNNLLKIAKETNVKGFLYLSSMEVYGNLSHELLNEDDVGILKIKDLRSSYPQSKRLTENLCISYAHEYDVDAKIVRLTLTFGPGVPESDNRVFAQFAKSAIKNEDIVLLTKGGTKRDYLYTADAVKGILISLLKGEKGEIYNLSNPDSYCSILDLAKMFCKVANSNSTIKFDLDEEKASKYAKEVHIQLDNTRIDNLGKFERLPFEQHIKNTLEYYKTFNSSSEHI